ncbi:MAG TPA: hypothetical protein VEC75_14620, partial [Stellaceae bacterium]|nr:hypothetical protein [Stellaceae bacterium]
IDTSQADPQGVRAVLAEFSKLREARADDADLRRAWAKCAIIFVSISIKSHPAIVEPVLAELAALRKRFNEPNLGQEEEAKK